MEIGRVGVLTGGMESGGAGSGQLVYHMREGEEGLATRGIRKRRICS